MDNYKTTIAFDLIPTYWSDLPKVKIRFNNKEEKLELSETTRIELVEELVPGNYLLEVEFFDKPEHSTQGSKDQMLTIDNLSVNGITHKKLLYAGIYHPIYPEPWASQQQDLKDSLPAITTMGWNGTWRLDISIPAFIWCHDTIGLGYHV